MMPEKESTTKPKQTREKRIFVLDTNVLLHDSNAIFAFKGVAIGIPFAVLEELDEFKKERNELGMNARHFIRILDGLRSQGDLSKGVIIKNGTTSLLMILPPPKEIDIKACAKTVDNIIIQSVINLVKEGYKATFVTKDINLRVKADSLGLDAEDYARGTITYEEYYKGWQAIQLSNAELKKASIKTLPDLLVDKKIFVNEFIVLQSQHADWSYRTFRYLGGKNFKEVFEKKFWQDFGPRNFQQTMALDLLLDDSVKMVSLLGPAGTGKTFLVLLAGLFKVIQEHFYRKLMVSRPVISLGADIGYLPGDVHEKLFHWMQPVYDNLEIIFGELEGHRLG
ncbi:PhoH family protein, partial [Candidatus Babeliales bacterium]|nr:PhoH family protein [Candidatus Babeliales bacterium]